MHIHINTMQNGKIMVIIPPLYVAKGFRYNGTNAGTIALLSVAY